MTNERSPRASTVQLVARHAAGRQDLVGSECPAQRLEACLDLARRHALRRVESKAVSSPFGREDQSFLLGCRPRPPPRRICRPRRLSAVPISEEHALPQYR